ncbi:protein SEC13 homolog [Sycon ciliatum]|uniref:protein SEC13 homolog n=1 Tax=Sycon ciliatum TaxID=27933 RepID=UPI0020AC2187|eukprot:scpid90118/ scgid11136/ Protein SEC13 homolog; SEC13-like protein 1
MVSLCNTVDTSHQDMIHDAQLDYYGKKLATCSSDRSVKILDVSGGNQRVIADLTGHQGPVWQVAWAHPSFGNVLASCSYDHKVIIWQEGPNSRWQKLYEYDKHVSSVNSVCWAPHEWGMVLACGSSDGNISILTYADNEWDTYLIKNAHAVGCNAVSWAPATAPLTVAGQSASPSVKRLVSGGCDNLVKIWCAESGQWTEEHSLPQHTDWIRDCAWAPTIGQPSLTIASCSQDQQVIIWTKDDSPGSAWQGKVMHKFDDTPWHVSWSITGDVLAVSSGDNKVTLWKESFGASGLVWTQLSEV